MTLKAGDTLPAVTMQVMGKDGPTNVSTDDIFKGKRVAVFGLPGAFTPTCSAQHVPGFLANADALAAKGIDAIVCLSVNDAFVMAAWGADQDVGDKIVMLADGSATFTKAIGLDLDLTARGMGVRCQRFSMVVNDGTVEAISVEAPGAFDVSSAEAMLAAL